MSTLQENEYRPDVTDPSLLPRGERRAWLVGSFILVALIGCMEEGTSSLDQQAPAGDAALDTDGGSFADKAASDTSRPPPRILFLNFGAVTLNAINTAAKPPERPNALLNRAWYAWEKNTCWPNRAVLWPLTQTCRKDITDRNSEYFCRAGTCGLHNKIIGTKIIAGKTVNYYRCTQPEPAFNTQILQIVSSALAPYNVRVVDKRPTSGRYDMVVFTMNVSCGFAGQGGMAPQGCGQPEINTVIYANQAQLFNWAPSGMANLILHEYGHSMGLRHYSGTTTIDPMGKRDPKLLPAYIDKCAPAPALAVPCAVSDTGCGENSQNTHQIMLNALGPAQ